MKKRFKLFAVLSMITLTITALLAGCGGGGSDFQYVKNDGGTLTITSYSGSDTEVVVPASINGTAVTAIGDRVDKNGYVSSVFDTNARITKVSLPDTIKSIRNDAFRNMSHLNSIVIPDGVNTIGFSAFQNCTELTSITIPKNVTTISSSAFAYCSKLASVYFEGNAPQMGDVVFDSTAPGLIIYYHNGASGFTNPWHNIRTATY